MQNSEPQNYYYTPRVFVCGEDPASFRVRDKGIWTRRLKENLPEMEVFDGENSSVRYSRSPDVIFITDISKETRQLLEDALASRGGGFKPGDIMLNADTCYEYHELLEFANEFNVPRELINCGISTPQIIQILTKARIDSIKDPKKPKYPFNVKVVDFLTTEDEASLVSNENFTVDEWMMIPSINTIAPLLAKGHRVVLAKEYPGQDFIHKYRRVLSSPIAESITTPPPKGTNQTDLIQMNLSGGTTDTGGNDSAVDDYGATPINERSLPLAA